MWFDSVNEKLFCSHLFLDQWRYPKVATSSATRFNFKKERGIDSLYPEAASQTHTLLAVWYFFFRSSLIIIIIIRRIVPVLLTAERCPQELSGIPPVAVGVVCGKAFIKRPGVFPPVSIGLVYNLLIVPQMYTFEKPIPMSVIWKKKSQSMDRKTEYGNFSYVYSCKSILPRRYISWDMPSLSHTSHETESSSRSGYTLKITFSWRMSRGYAPNVWVFYHAHQTYSLKIRLGFSSSKPSSAAGLGSSGSSSPAMTLMFDKTAAPSLSSSPVSSSSS